jgi:hypothetical protein
LQKRTVVLGQGDAHVNNFGTWRDEQGRLVWGINDFDDAALVPYPNDLVRLVTSARLADQDLSSEQVSEWVLTGYVGGLDQGGQPFVLQEENDALRDLAHDRFEDPDSFWKEEQGEKKATEIANHSEIPFIVRTHLLSKLPPGATDVRMFARHARVGSLGRPRYSVVADWRGGKIAREIKQLVPSAWTWARAAKGSITIGQGQPNYRRLLGTAVRCADPFAHVTGDDAWMVRRLAPDCVRIELKEKKKKKKEEEGAAAEGGAAATPAAASKTAGAGGKAAK